MTRALVTDRSTVTAEIHATALGPDGQLPPEVFGALLGSLRAHLADLYPVTPIRENALRVVKHYRRASGDYHVTAAWTPEPDEVELNGGPFDGDLVAMPRDLAEPLHDPAEWLHLEPLTRPLIRPLGPGVFPTGVTEYRRAGINPMTGRWAYTFVPARKVQA